VSFIHQLDHFQSMAPVHAHRTAETSLPLADYFWIAGLDGQQLVEAYAPSRRSTELSDATNGIENVIHEEPGIEPETSSILPSPRQSTWRAGKDSHEGRSQLPDEAPDSVPSVDGSVNVRSNRSSLTVRPVVAPGPRMSSAMSEADFENALNKFALDRDTFFLDLNFSMDNSANPSRTKSRRQTQKIVVPEEFNPVPTRSFGSIRRHLSFRDMTSTRLQPSVARRGEYHRRPSMSVLTRLFLQCRPGRRGE